MYALYEETKMFRVSLTLKLCDFKNRKYSLLNLEMYVIKQIIGSAEYPIRIFIFTKHTSYGALKVPMFSPSYYF